MVTNEMIEVCLQPIQEKFIKISLLQNFFVSESGHQVRRFRKIGEIQGNAISGSIDINTNSTFRRTCNIEMSITDNTFLVAPNKKIWLDKWFRLELGIRSLKTGEIVWFNKGIYAINNPSVRLSLAEKTLSISGVDLMATLDGTLGGALMNVTKMTAGTNITDAIKTTVWQLGKISQSQIYIENNNLSLPYDIEKSSTDTVYSLINEIRQLYMDWEIFFNEDGRFIYRKIKNRYIENPTPFTNDVVQFSFLDEFGLISNYDVDYDFDNVKNKIKIWGKLHENGTQISYELINTNPKSPFNINTNIGTIPYAISDDKIFTQEQAKQRAEYEMYLYSNMNERLSIDLVPMYFLDVNTLVEFDEPDIEMGGKYLIDTMSIPLNVEGVMNLTAHKVYAQ